MFFENKDCKTPIFFIIFVFFVIFIIFVITSIYLYCDVVEKNESIIEKNESIIEKNESIIQKNNLEMFANENKNFGKKGGSELSQKTNHEKNTNNGLIKIDEEIAKKYNLSKLELESYTAEKNPAYGVKYVNPAANKQIQTLLKSNKKDMFSVLELLAKHIKTDAKGFIKHLVNKGWSLLDSDIYGMILKSYQSQSEKSQSEKSQSEKSQSEKSQSENNTRDKLHANLYVGYLRKYMPDFAAREYLDFGCGDCNKTELVGKLLGLDPKNVHGVDVSSIDNDVHFNSQSEKTQSEKTQSEKKQSEKTQSEKTQVKPQNNLQKSLQKSLQKTSFLHYDINRNPAVNFKLIKNNKLDYPDGAFNLISAFMVLHHVKDLHEVCAELSRVLVKNGVLILREHDAYNAADYMLCDIEHAIYDLGYPNSQGVARNPDFVKNYYAKYHSWLEWAELLGEFGFTLVAREYDNFSIKKNIGPTRYICLVFCKK